MNMYDMMIISFEDITKIHTIAHMSLSLMTAEYCGYL